MNGGGKSDRSIVPEMLSNKACGAPQTAEKAEERDLTKENPLQQHEFRTQCREKEYDMDHPKRARSGKPRTQPREEAYVNFPNLQSALQRIRQAFGRHYPR